MRNSLVFCLILGLAAISSQSLFSSVEAAWLDSHNAARRSVNAGIPDLVYDTTLEQYAQNWANHQATQDSCRLTHSGGKYGENIYWSSGSATQDQAVNAWVAEKQYYNYASNSCASGKVCGHYTQVVWRNTKSLGCGSAKCSGGGTFIVCSYNPPGNFVGQKPY